MITPDIEAEIRRIIREEIDDDLAVRQAYSPDNLQLHAEHYRSLRAKLEERRKDLPTRGI